jgi:TRAP-type uncharacterized transport system fused permease subunit
VFVYHPPLILKGDLADVLLGILTAAVGVILLAMGCAGYLFRPIRWPLRSVFCLAGLILFAPPIPGVNYVLLNAVGLAIGVAAVLFQRAVFRARGGAVRAVAAQAEPGPSVSILRPPS